MIGFGVPAVLTGSAHLRTPGYVIEYATDERGEPSWPWLQAGFFGDTGAAHGPRLGIAGVDPGGAAMFDATGQFVGIALPADARSPAHGRWVPVSALRKALPLFDERRPVSPESSSAREESTAARSPRQRLGFDAMHERTMPRVLQVLVRD